MRVDPRARPGKRPITARSREVDAGSCLILGCNGAQPYRCPVPVVAPPRQLLRPDPPPPRGAGSDIGIILPGGVAIIPVSRGRCGLRRSEHSSHDPPDNGLDGGGNARQTRSAWVSMIPLLSLPALSRLATGPVTLRLATIGWGGVPGAGPGALMVRLFWSLVSRRGRSIPGHGEQYHQCDR